MRSNSLRSLWAAVLVSSAAMSASAALPPAENLLPADTLVLLDVPNFAVLRSASHESPQWLFWNDPAMKPFHDKFVQNWQSQVVGPLEHDLGVKLDDFAGLLQGQLAFAVTQNGWTGTNDVNPGILLLLDSKDKSGALTTNLDNLRKKWITAGKPLRTETLHGIRFSVVTLSSNDMPGILGRLFPARQPVQELGKADEPAPPPGKLYVGQYESLLIAGTTRDGVDTVAARLTGGSNPSLNNNSIFAADQGSRFRNAPLYYGWFNAKAFFGVLAQLPQAGANPDAPSPFPAIPWANILTASGLGGLKSISFTCSQSHAGTFADVYVSAPESAREGIIKILAANRKDANPPPFVPADAAKFWRWRMDGSRAWGTLQKMLGDISPVVLTSLNSFLEIANASGRDQDPDFDIRKNLFANLGDDWISYQKAATGKTFADLNQAPSILLFAAARPDEAALAVRRVVGMAASQENAPPTREFLGRKIYAIAMRPKYTGGNGTDPGTPQPRALYCTASGGYVALSDDVSMIEDYLRSTQNHVKPLRQREGLSEAISRIGGADDGLFGYENQNETMRALFSALKNDPNAAIGGDNPLLRLWGISLGDFFDFSLLPDYGRVSKYFYFTVYNGRADSEGLSFKFFTPRPPQLQ